MTINCEISWDPGNEVLSANMEGYMMVGYFEPTMRLFLERLTAALLSGKLPMMG